MTVEWDWVNHAEVYTGVSQTEQEIQDQVGLGERSVRVSWSRYRSDVTIGVCLGSSSSENRS